MIKIAFVIYSVFITGVSLMPSEITPNIGLWDKGTHFMAYLIFTILASGLTKIKKRFIFISLSIIVYSGLIEIAQSAVPGRMMSAHDLLANSSGVAVGILLVFFIKWIRQGYPHTKSGPS